MKSFLIELFIDSSHRVNWEKSLVDHQTVNTSLTNTSNAVIIADAVEMIEPQRTHYLYTYALIMITLLYLVFQRSALVIAVCIRASRHLHDKLFRGVIRAPMRFFNTNSSGRIINRFSKDIGHIDTTLAPVFYDSAYVSARDERYFE